MVGVIDIKTAREAKYEREVKEKERLEDDLNHVVDMWSKKFTSAVNDDTSDLDVVMADLNDRINELERSIKRYKDSK